jgi:hypothetical protein
MVGINMASISNEAIVIKSNPILEARYRKNLDPREMDLLTILFTAIRKGDDGEIETVRLSIAELIRVLNINSGSAYKDLARITRNLSGISVDIWEEESQKLAQRVIITDTEYYYGKGYADFYFNQKLARHLIDLQNYAKYILKYFIRLDSFYAKRIYELVAQYRNMPRDKHGEWKRRISITELRQYLGIQSKEYSRFSNFRMRVLKFSIDQINERTDINLECEEIKSGRTPEELLFIASEKDIVPDYVSISFMAPDPTASKDYARLVAYGVDEPVARSLVSEHPAEVVAYNLERLDAALKRPKRGNIEDPAAWLVAGIRAGRGEQLTLLKPQEAGTPVHESKEDEAKKKLERKGELKAILLPVREAYKKYLRTTLEGFIFGLSDDEQKDHKDGFIKYMKGKYGPNIVGAPSFALAQFEKESWFSSVVIAYAVDYFSTYGLYVIDKIEFSLKKGVKNYEELSKELAEIERGI